MTADEHVRVIRPSDGARRVFSGAYGASIRGDSPGPVGTAQILVGCTSPGIGEVGRVLGEFVLTLPVVMTGFRTAEWATDDEDPAAPPAGTLGEVEWFGTRRRKQMNLTGAARAAIGRAMASAASAGRVEFDPDDLLAALLTSAPAVPAPGKPGPDDGQPSNRAVELLVRSGVDPADVLRRLAGGPAPDRPVEVLDPDLAPTRDALLGRVPYRIDSVWGRFGYRMLRLMGANLATVPVPWAGMDARDQARRLGHRRTRTAHLLLALLAIEEVTRALPHMIASSPE
jgi:hypothetical protein